MSDPAADIRRGYGYPGGMSVAPIAEVTGLSLSPTSAGLALGTQTHHRLTATVAPPRANVRVDFEVKPHPPQGPGHNVLGFAYTSDAGVATFAYPGTVAGVDQILASIGPLTSCPVNPPCHTATWSGSVTAPTIDILSPSNLSAFAPNTSVLVSGVARSGQGRYPITHITVSGTPVEALDDAGNFFTRVTVGPGHNDFLFRATDLVGQSATATLTLRGDAPPVDFSQLADVTASAVVQYERTSLNEKTDVLYLSFRRLSVHQCTPVIS